MDRKQEAVALTCHNFSDIRRRPLVIGKLDQVRLPFVVTMPQLAVGALTFGFLFATKAVWGAVMSDRLHIVVFVAVPVLVAQQVSRTSIEGRSVAKGAMGYLRLLTAPRDGEINGRRRREPGESPLHLQPLVPRAERVRRSRRGEQPRRSRRAEDGRTSRRSERRHRAEALHGTPGQGDRTHRTHRAHREGGAA